jgi:hypothetical protein
VHEALASPPVEASLTGAIMQRPVSGFATCPAVQAQVPSGWQVPQMLETSGLSLQVWFAPGVQGSGGYLQRPVLGLMT